MGYSIALQFYVFAEFKEGNETAFGEQSSYEMPNNIFENNKTFEKYQTSYLSDVDIDDLEVMYIKLQVYYR